MCAGLIIFIRNARDKGNSPVNMTDNVSKADVSWIFYKEIASAFPFLGIRSLSEISPIKIGPCSYSLASLTKANIEYWAFLDNMIFEKFNCC
jgi:hypothetical protein